MSFITHMQLFILLTLMGITLFAFSSDEDAAATRTRLQLADAFTSKDMQTISKLVSDSYSGLRHCSGWDDVTWAQAGKALRDAKVVSGKGNQILYTTHWPNSPEDKRTREIIFYLHDSVWELNLNSFLGPFPNL